MSHDTLASFIAKYCAWLENDNSVLSNPIREK